ncbi:MAG: hypothetical protein EON59_01525 [Alphaproteobacteria bacterium]|nr:MAG: hypothetical protein EON59_01525 [Alphaproteobacteria bacterium]
MHRSDHWCRDLLGLWTPPGHPSGDYGLRLAIRDGYMNFYRRGQSVARVGFDRSGEPQLSVHAKYVCTDEERGLPNLRYAGLRDSELTHRGLPTRPYEGVRTLQSWIEVIDKHFTKTDGEKPLIDALLGVRENANVIDLEMALPASVANSAAPRMDVVTVEQLRDRLSVVFGEVKRVDDSRIRCGKEGTPEVLRQLAAYAAYLGDDRRRGAVGKAYAHTAQRLVRLNAWAASVRGEMGLGEAIERAAKEASLGVVKEAVLVVISTGRFSGPHWQVHADRLRSAGVRITELSDADPMNLGALV